MADDELDYGRMMIDIRMVLMDLARGDVNIDYSEGAIMGIIQNHAHERNRRSRRQKVA